MFDNLSPLDSRYRADNPDLWQALSDILSEEAYIGYLLQVESALSETLADWGLCSQDIADEIRKACEMVQSDEVQTEELKTRHNIRALVNCIQRSVSVKARPFVHLTATSVDIMDTARSLQVRDCLTKIILPQVRQLLGLWIAIALKEADTPQVGRTHGQHGVPITFGFAMAEYVSRMGTRLKEIQRSADNLKGKMAGAVGAYNASALFFEDPMKFEEDVLAKLNLQPGDHSTQMVEPEYLNDVFHGIVTAFGVLGNFADDMRHLQRTEIAEVGEEFAPGQVGSSTMPHKRNPWNYENIKSMWKTFMPRMITVYMDQISEHQRDLSNSASGRFGMEILAGFSLTMARTIRVTEKLAIHREQMHANLCGTAAMTAAEPLYILLAAVGHPDAHEFVRNLTLQVQDQGGTLLEWAMQDPEAKTYLDVLTPQQKEILADPTKYKGAAGEKTRRICAKWNDYLEGQA